MHKEVSHYDPREKSEDGSTSDGVVWTSKSVEWAREAISLGQKLKGGNSPFYENNPLLRKGNLIFKYSPEEYQEIIKCSMDINYFIENYCKIKRPDGKIGKIKLRDYQVAQIDDYLNNDRIILGWSRQSGKTIGTSLYILWNLMFQADKHAAILANKSATSSEVLTKIKEIYHTLPFFMQAGIMGVNTTLIAFDNGCRVYTGPATKDALNGKTCNILYIDELAFVGKGANKIKFQKDFLANAIPVLSSQKDSGLCKLIITSTPDGKEYFYELFSNALKSKNDFKGSKICWWKIPGRTQEWADSEIRTIGLSKFKQQFEMSFDVTESTLLELETLKRLTSNLQDYETGAFDLISEKYSEYLFTKKDIEIDFDKDFICLSVDIAEGLKKDYSTIQILRLDYDIDIKEFKYNQIGVFRCNHISIDEFAVLLMELYNNFNVDGTKVLVEQNTYGDYLFKCMQTNEDYEIDLSSICKFKRSVDAPNATKGLRTNSQIKSIGVKSFKTLMDNNVLNIAEKNTISEIENFQQDAKGNYNASIGHDDTVAPLINFSYFVHLKGVEFNNWVEDYLESINISTIQNIDSIEEQKAFENLTPEEKEYFKSL